MAEFTDLDLGFLSDDPQEIYLVGGTVRDLLMGHMPADIDLVVGGDINRVAREIAHKTDGRIVDLGKNGFAILRVAAPEKTIDITPMGGSSIESDLRQRDFTINAMAYEVKARRLVDCTGGLDDLHRQTIRLVSASAFTKDPARLVRTYRLAAQFHFSISKETREAVGSHAQQVNRVAGERVWAELVKLFTLTNSASMVRCMAEDGLLTAVFPELTPSIGCGQNRHHQFDVFTHSIEAYAMLERLLNDADSRFGGLVPAGGLNDLSAHTPVLKYAALLHDVGKPATRQVDDHGRTRFPGHAGRSAVIAAAISRRLRLSRRQSVTADAVIRHHIRPLFLFLSMQKGTLGQRGMVRFFNRCGTLSLPIIVHAMADIMAKGDRLQPRDTDFIAFCDRLMAGYHSYRDRQASGPPLIDGNDLIRGFGLSPSPRFKRILDRVEERRLSGELTTRDEALKWVGEYLMDGESFASVSK